jgi:hypothetical protein
MFSSVLRTLGALAIGAAVGCLAALGWALVVNETGYEIGFAAVAVGYVTGFGAFVGVGLCRPRWFFTAAGVPVLVTSAALLSLGAIVLGKYLTFALIADEALGDLGRDAPAMVSGEMWDLFREMGSVVWSGYDILWIVLALVASAKGAFAFGPSSEPTPLATAGFAYPSSTQPVVRDDGSVEGSICWGTEADPHVPMHRVRRVGDSGFTCPSCSSTAGA